MLTEGSVISWVGTEQAADRLASTATVDLDGALVTPAFVDAHVHATATGLALDGLDLSAAPSLTAALRRLEAHARSARGGVVLGTGWDETRWPERRPPTANELDRAAYGGVVYLARVDVHSAVVSHALLAAVPGVAGLAGYGPDGLVAGAAHHALRRAAYGSLSGSQRTRAQRSTRRRAAELGIACLHEMAGPEISGEDDLVGLLALAGSEPGPRVIGYWGSLGDVETSQRLGISGAGGDLFCDGTFGSHTAALSTPYADADGSGALQFGPAEVAEHVRACAAVGLQAGFHVIGDAAIDAVLDGLGRAAAVVGLDRIVAGRHRLEHVEMPSADAIAAMARYGVVASVQPAFDATWGGTDAMYAERLGPARAGTLNPFAAMAAAGIPMALSSDAPVTALDPWGGVRAAVMHRTPGFGLSARAAFSAATRGGWRAAGIDGYGELRAGASATFAVWAAGELSVQVPDDRVAAWSTDPRSAVPGLPDLSAAAPRCLRTVVEGTTVYDAGPG
ncbi:MAG: amidohydrolase [Mycobacteriales bacterium]